MKLFKRDYNIITPEEQAEWEVEKEKEVVYINGGKTPFQSNRFCYYPKAVRHFLSLFPNNYLDPVELDDIERLTDIVDQFEKLFQSDYISESEIIKFIKEKRAYFIIGSILKNNYNFGHHDAFVFPEFMLGNSFQADFLLVGRSSGGWEFVFVEFESPLGRITTKDGNLAQVFRKGIHQIEKWDAWIDANYQTLKETFDRSVHPEQSLPDEFIRLDKTRIHYLVVAGRRKCFMKDTYRLRRKYRDNNKITLLHYDNIIDDARYTIGKFTY